MATMNSPPHVKTSSTTTPTILPHTLPLLPSQVASHHIMHHSAPPPPFRVDLPHHRLYDFAKAALIKIFASPYSMVCDLYCGGGADIDKWDDAQIGHYVGIDASVSGINEARETLECRRKPYAADFWELDPSIEIVESRVHEKGVPADIVCCMQHLQFSFQSENRARRLLSNVSSLLKPGGYFFGITPDSSTIWIKYQKILEASHNKSSSLKPSNIPNSIRSENYTITFEAAEEKFPLFGKKFQLKFANDVSPETHNLVHFPSLIRLARDAGLEYVEIQNLTEFYDDNRAQLAGMLHSYGVNFLDSRGKLVDRSLDMLGLYAVFVFQKPDPDATPPLPTPLLDEKHMNEEECPPHSSWWQHASSTNEEKNADTTLNGNNSLAIESDKGILGPGPTDLRFLDPMI